MMIPPVLADAIFWVAVACCVVAQAAIMRSVLAAPPAPRRGLEVAWAAAPAVALALVLVATWRTLHPADAPPAAARSAEVRL
jgi:heme/copper-type cytochrome/quinol oxidase subunit 2